MDKDHLLKQVKGIVRNHLSDDYRVMIFGSWTKGNALKNSDLDIAILGQKPVPRNSMVKISQEVDDLPTLRSIDVVDLQAVEEKFKNQVLEHAQTL